MNIQESIRVHSIEPIETPPIKTGIPSDGYMALNPHPFFSSFVIYRKVPENRVDCGWLLLPGDTQYFQLKNLTTILSKTEYPLTEKGEIVLGYEDPTYLPFKSPFDIEFEGFLATQVYPRSEGGVYTNLVLAQYEPLTKRVLSLREVITRENAITQGLAQEVSMVKEGEVFDTNKIIFEYNNSAGSHIGIGKVENNLVVRSTPFRTAPEDGSAHISTMASPINTEKGSRILFFNRRRDTAKIKEWGITLGILENNQIKYTHPDWFLRAQQDQGLGPDGQLIAFGSSTRYLGNRHYEILYHVNDNRPFRSVVEINI